ncbi:hypothetical protein HPB47_000975 [Ixodes persulcatus]|uniref:Uncharacterized protein n=1 Tax=Ixodes persulcatus TaxID=34615 RepID=A0AC60PQC6_IXOPE|nr:hypothetical protein HPB47_000975 [Ixodes persulcatus]
MAEPKGTTRIVVPKILAADSRTTKQEIMDMVKIGNPILRIVNARRMGRSQAILFTLGTERAPDYFVYGSMITKFYIYRDRKQARTACRQVLDKDFNDYLDLTDSDEVVKNLAVAALNIMSTNVKKAASFKLVFVKEDAISLAQQATSTDPINGPEVPMLAPISVWETVEPFLGLSSSDKTVGPLTPPPPLQSLSILDLSCQDLTY